MKILIVSNLYPPNTVGGYERLCFSVAEALVERGHAVTVLTSDYGGGVASYPGQDIRRDLALFADTTDIYKPFSISDEERARLAEQNAQTLRATVESTRPDLIFVWNLYFYDNSLIAAIAECGVPAVLFLTDNWLIAADRPSRIHEFFGRYVHGDEVFDPAAAAREPGQGSMPRLSAIYGADFVRALYESVGITFENQWVVHNGVDLPADILAPQADRRELLRPGHLRLLFAGRVVDLKGAIYCVRSLKQIMSELPGTEVTLDIVGDTQDQAYLALLIEAIEADGLAAHVNLLPPVAEADLASLWNSHDIYLFPSLYEPFSLTLIHALAAGIPTVASDIGGNVEIVYHGRTGALFRSRDAQDIARQVVALARDGEMRDRVARQGRILGRKFTFGRMITQLELLLERAAGL